MDSERRSPAGSEPSDGAVTRSVSPSTAGAVGLVGTSPGKIGMWVFLAADVMGFAGLLLAYAMLRARTHGWPDPATRFDRPLAAVLTFILLLSGATMTATVAAARDGRMRVARAFLTLTALAGTVFVAGQAMEFHALASTRHIGLTVDHGAALFYVITAYHGLHVLVGLAVLMLTGFRSLAQATDQPGTLEVVSLYWQFVDVVWIVIFTTLYLLPPFLPQVVGG